MKERVVIVGNKSGAEIMHGYLSDDKRYEVLGFAVNKEFISDSHLLGLKVYDLDNLSQEFGEGYKLIMGVGYSNVNLVRKNLFESLKDKGHMFLTYIHPTAFVSSSAQIGEGSVVLSNSVIEPFTQIGSNSLVWCNCTIAHHSRLGNHCWIASNSVVSGSAYVNDLTFVGVGSIIVNEVNVASKNIIGAGSIITKSTKEDEVYLMRNAEKHRFNSQDYARFFIK